MCTLGKLVFFFKIAHFYRRIYFGFFCKLRFLKKAVFQNKTWVVYITIYVNLNKIIKMVSTCFNPFLLRDLYAKDSRIKQ